MGEERFDFPRSDFTGRLPWTAPFAMEQEFPDPPAVAANGERGEMEALPDLLHAIEQFHAP
jgi:hypothetical protein